MALKRKRVLITAGPTWVRLDPVRVISNIATGETGRRLASAAARKGAQVTLLLGPGDPPVPHKNISVKRFTFFDELRKLFHDEVMQGYDAIIHSAAVSDYRPLNTARIKIPSGIKCWHCNFLPTPKLINMIKKSPRKPFAVGFKYEPYSSVSMLLKKGKGLMDYCRLDAVVANRMASGKYEAYIITPMSVSPAYKSKAELVRQLIKLVFQ